MPSCGACTCARAASREEDLGAGRERTGADVDVVRLLAAYACVDVGGDERVEVRIVELLVRQDGVPGGAPHSLRLREVLTDSESSELLKCRVPLLKRTDVPISKVVEQLEASADGTAVKRGREVLGKPGEVDRDHTSDLQYL